MQVLPSNPFLPSLLHHQFLARGGLLPPPAPVVPPVGAGAPHTPPSSEDNMSPPPPATSHSRKHKADRHAEEEMTSTYDQERARDFKCPLCSDQMTSLKEFTTHLRGHNEVKPTTDPTDPTGQAKVYNCCLCGKMLSSFSSLDRHMLVHSGERPFSCEVCGQTFTTNGNMHRHRRTHNATRDSCESSDGSGQGAGGKRTRKRKAGGGSSSHAGTPADKHSTASRSGRGQASAATALNDPLPFRCMLCPERFVNEITLDMHIIKNHPGRELKCEDCGHPCPNHNYYKLHRSLYHLSSSPASSRGLSHGLLSPDNSFATAAAAAAISGPLAGSSLPGLIAASTAAGLSLPSTFGHHNAPLHWANPGLANPHAGLPQMLMSASRPGDVGLLSSGTNHSETSGSPPPVMPPLISLTDGSGSPCRKENDSNHEDVHNSSFCSDGVQQDNDPVLKEMKLKGEFPCRVCPLIFPNLRALKGHNKEHMINPPFECNVGTCHYQSGDKSILLQHMRVHTGQKPFECRICNFGFTTKANCERHVRNKHNKNSKDDVRDHILIHEGVTADDDDCSRDYVTSKPTVDDKGLEAAGDINGALSIFPPTPPRSTSFMPFRTFENTVDKDIVESDIEVEDEEEIEVEKTTDDEVSPKSGRLGNLEEGDVPLDLSKATVHHDVVETASRPRISVKKSDDLKSPDAKDQSILPGENKPEPETGRLPNMPPAFPPAAFPFGLPFLPSPAGLAPQSVPPPPGLWPPAAHPLAGFAPSAGFSLRMAHHLAMLLAAKNDQLKKQSEQESIKETLQSLNHMQDLANCNMQSPGSAVAAGLLGQISPSSNSNASTLSPQSSPAKHLSSAIGSSHREQSAGESAYKMIIKNGVLMRKQKQRRYRTERPYGCEECKARFTLRSNMDRHMKQQHPEVYYRKPRSGPGRKPGRSKLNPSVMPGSLQGHQDNGLSLLAGLSANEISKRLTFESYVNDFLKKKESLEMDGQKDMADFVPKMSYDIAEYDDEDGIDDDEEFEDEELEVGEEGVQNLVIDDIKADNEEETKENSEEATKCEEEQNPDDDDMLQEEMSNHASDESKKKTSAYSAAPQRMACPFCSRKFPWASSLERHILTHTGQKPFKCTECSLWFTTKSNCDRHIIRKHGNNNNNSLSIKEKDEEHSMEEYEEGEDLLAARRDDAGAAMENFDDSRCRHESTESAGSSGATSAGNSSGSGVSLSVGAVSTTPYKCHLCEDGFADKSDAIAHLEERHEDEYRALVAKGAFDSSASATEAEVMAPDTLTASVPASGGANSGEEQLYDHLRGRFPDYVNRKIVCLFCERKFWSAEDLRRHVRTHTGERPYSCDICSRRFTLKHSMLRHKKKHDSGMSSNGEGSDGDDSVSVASGYSRDNTATPEPLANGHDVPQPDEEAVKAVPEQGYDKKRANLMETISRLATEFH